MGLEPGQTARPRAPAPPRALAPLSRAAAATIRWTETRGMTRRNWLTYPMMRRSAPDHRARAGAGDVEKFIAVGQQDSPSVGPIMVAQDDFQDRRFADAGRAPSPTHSPLATVNQTHRRPAAAARRGDAA